MYGKINIQLDRVIYQMLCIYAFLIPLEKVLLVLFDLDTVFKPYRVVALLILFAFGVKLTVRVDKNAHLKRDLFLYLIFAYGIVITLIRMITEKFNLGYLYNDTFQLGIYLGIFVVMRHTQLGRKQLLLIFQFFAAGAIVNAMYVFYGFFFLQIYRRTAGLMDNPNYLALSLVVVMFALIVYRIKARSIVNKVLWLVLIVFLGNVFMMAGSRTALAVFSIGVVLTFFMATIRQKLMLVATTVGLILIVSIGGNYFQNQGPLILLNRVQKKSSADDRIPLWKGTIRAAQKTNFAGVGVGQFKARFHEFYQQENNDFIRRIKERGYFASPHSDYLALLAIYGAFGLLCYLIFLFLSGRELFIKLIYATDIETKMYYQLNALILLALVLFGFTAESFNSAMFWILLTISTQTLPRKMEQNANGISDY